MKQSITEKIEIMLDMGEWDAAKKMIAALEAENAKLRAAVEAVEEYAKHFDKPKYLLDALERARGGQDGQG